MRRKNFPGRKQQRREEALGRILKAVKKNNAKVLKSASGKEKQILKSKRLDAIIVNTTAKFVENAKEIRTKIKRG